MNKSRERMKMIKGFVIGVVCTMLLSGTVLMANPVTRDLLFGVRVSVDGVMVNFDEDSLPFVLDGRTFLPVRAIADVFGAGVDFDPATNTVLLTTTQQHTATRLAETLFNYSVRTTGANNWVRSVESAGILGTQHNNVVQFSAFGTVDLTSEYNLGGNYSRLTGVFGRADGSHPTGVAVTILGDGNVIMEFEKGEHDTPLNIDIDVSGVQIIRIYVYPDGRGGPAGTTGGWVFSADLN